MRKFLIKTFLFVFVLSGLVTVFMNTAAKADPRTLTAPTLNISLKSRNSATLLLSSTFSADQFVSSSAISLGYQAVYFVQDTEFASKGWMQIGLADINAPTVGRQTNATVSYDPTWTGEETFKVELVQSQNGSNVVLNSSTTVYNVLKDPSGFPASEINYQRPLSQVGKWLVRGLLTLIALVWILMFGVLGFVINRVSKNGKVALNG